MTDDNDTNWDDVSFIISSAYRREVMYALDEGPATPSSIAESTEYDISHVSRALRSLRERELTELLVPEGRKKGRIYGATEHGEKAVEVIEDRGL